MSILDLLGDAREVLAELPNEVEKFKASWFAATQGMGKDVVPAAVVQTVETKHWSISIYLLKTPKQDAAVAICTSLEDKPAVCAALPVAKGEDPADIAKRLFTGILREFKET